MAYPYDNPYNTPRDVAVGNNFLPLLQMMAQHDRRARGWLASQQTGQPMAAPEARAPGPAEPLSLFPEQPPPVQAQPQQQPQAGVISRQSTPIPASGPRPAASPAPAAQGLGEMLAGLSPDERNMMRTSMLAGMAGGLSDTLARRPNAGFGEMLLGAGAGGLSGQMAGRQGVRAERRQGMAEQLTQSQLASAQAKAQQDAAQRARVEAMLGDPAVPDSQKRILEMSLAGVPGGAIRAMVPEQMTPYQQRSLDLRERQIEQQGQQLGQMTPYQQASLGLQRERLGQMQPLEEVYDPETGATTYAPRSQAVGMQVPPAGTRAGQGTALMQNVPFVAKALNIPEGEATKMLLTPAGGRKTPEQMRADFTKSMLSNPMYASNPERAVQAADEVMQRLSGSFEEAPAVTEAPTEGWGDYISGFLPDFMGSESDTAEAAPTALEAPAAAAGDIGSMGYEELEALDQYSMSAEDRERARLRWDQLNAGED